MPSLQQVTVIAVATVLYLSASTLAFFADDTGSSMITDASRSYWFTSTFIDPPKPKIIIEPPSTWNKTLSLLSYIGLDFPSKFQHLYFNLQAFYTSHDTQFCWPLALSIIELLIDMMTIYYILTRINGFILQRRNTQVHAQMIDEEPLVKIPNNHRFINFINEKPHNGENQFKWNHILKEEQGREEIDGYHQLNLETYREIFKESQIPGLDYDKSRDDDFEKLKLLNFDNSFKDYKHTGLDLQAESDINASCKEKASQQVFATSTDSKHLCHIAVQVDDVVDSQDNNLDSTLSQPHDTTSFSDQNRAAKVVTEKVRPNSSLSKNLNKDDFLHSDFGRKEMVDKSLSAGDIDCNSSNEDSDEGEFYHCAEYNIDNYVLDSNKSCTTYSDSFSDKSHSEEESDETSKYQVDKNGGKIRVTQTQSDKDLALFMQIVEDERKKQHYSDDVDTSSSVETSQSETDQTMNLSSLSSSTETDGENMSLPLKKVECMSVYGDAAVKDHEKKHTTSTQSKSNDRKFEHLYPSQVSSTGNVRNFKMEEGNGNKQMELSYNKNQLHPASKHNVEKRVKINSNIKVTSPCSNDAVESGSVTKQPAMSPIKTKSTSYSDIWNKKRDALKGVRNVTEKDKKNMLADKPEPKRPQRYRSNHYKKVSDQSDLGGDSYSIESREDLESSRSAYSSQCINSVESDCQSGFKNIKVDEKEMFGMKSYSTCPSSITSMESGVSSLMFHDRQPKFPLQSKSIEEYIDYFENVLSILSETSMNSFNLRDDGKTGSEVLRSISKDEEILNSYSSGVCCLDKNDLCQICFCKKCTEKNNNITTVIPSSRQLDIKNETIDTKPEAQHSAIHTDVKFDANAKFSIYEKSGLRKDSNSIVDQTQNNDFNIETNLSDKACNRDKPTSSKTTKDYSLSMKKYPNIKLASEEGRKSASNIKGKESDVNIKSVISDQTNYISKTSSLSMTKIDDEGSKHHPSENNKKPHSSKVLASAPETKENLPTQDDSSDFVTAREANYTSIKNFKHSSKNDLELTKSSNFGSRISNNAHVVDQIVDNLPQKCDYSHGDIDRNKIVNYSKLNKDGPEYNLMEKTDSKTNCANPSKNGFTSLKNSNSTLFEDNHLQVRGLFEEKSKSHNPLCARSTDTNPIQQNTADTKYLENNTFKSLPDIYVNGNNDTIDSAIQSVGISKYKRAKPTEESLKPQENINAKPFQNLSEEGLVTSKNLLNLPQNIQNVFSNKNNCNPKFAGSLVSRRDNNIDSIEIKLEDTPINPFSEFNVDLLKDTIRNIESKVEATNLEVKASLPNSMTPLTSIRATDNYSSLGGSNMQEHNRLIADVFKKERQNFKNAIETESGSSDTDVDDADPMDASPYATTTNSNLKLIESDIERFANEIESMNINGIFKSDKNVPLAHCIYDTRPDCNNNDDILANSSESCVSSSNARSIGSLLSITSEFSVHEFFNDRIRQLSELSLALSELDLSSNPLSEASNISLATTALKNGCGSSVDIEIQPLTSHGNLNNIELDTKHRVSSDKLFQNSLKGGCEKNLLLTSKAKKSRASLDCSSEISSNENNSNAEHNSVVDSNCRKINGEDKDFATEYAIGRKRENVKGNNRSYIPVPIKKRFSEGKTVAASSFEVASNA